MYIADFLFRFALTAFIIICFAAVGADPQWVLPQPWPSQATAVTMVGLIAQRRRIAKRLMFVALVPEQEPALPQGQPAVHLRRLWSNPETGEPCEVRGNTGRHISQLLFLVCCFD